MLGVLRDEDEDILFNRGIGERLKRYNYPFVKMKTIRKLMGWELKETGD